MSILIILVFFITAYRMHCNELEYSNEELANAFFHLPQDVADFFESEHIYVFVFRANKKICVFCGFIILPVNFELNSRPLFTIFCYLCPHDLQRRALSYLERIKDTAIGAPVKGRFISI